MRAPGATSTSYTDDLGINLKPASAICATARSVDPTEPMHMWSVLPWLAEPAIGRAARGIG